MKIDTLKKLAEILQNNPYVQAYKHAAAVVAEQNQHMQPIELRFVDNVNADLRRYNRPTADEIAGVFVSENGEPPTHRYVVAHYKQGGPRLLSTLSPHCDPMIYPLIFPSGEPGWDSQLTHNGIRRQPSRNHLTQLQFISNRLAVRGYFSHLHQSGKLFQQYLVDLYTRVEGERLHYLRNNQSSLRVEQMCGLQDFVVRRAHEQELMAGKMVILPSTFQGSPRNMTQNYQDAMSIVRKFGKPDLFITFTCNPQWPEIQSALSDGEDVSNRPDIVSRVFRLKLDELKKDLFERHVFGEVVAYVYVIEFQKRGLPHCHMLLILDAKAKFREPADIDHIVSAELPDPSTFPRLHKTVLLRMIHGPCGDRNPQSPCMVDGKCSKMYPREFVQNTVQNTNGYPIYRRRNTGISSVKGVHQVNNQDVVPFNPYLLLKYDAHINVEICSSVKSVKYLFKYVYKGYDCASMAFSTNTTNGALDYDEILSYANMRYVSSHEACWRLNENEMHQQSHTIQRLALHEEDKQNVCFVAGREEQALENATSRHTTLTAWFELNKTDIVAKSLLYHEIPNHYIFKNNKWQMRLRGGNKVIGRMYAVAPNDPERYYLRILLLHVPGATSFADLRTYNGVTASTFREAAIQRGLLSDDSEWHRTMEEMSLLHLPKQLRQIFAFICCFCQPSSPLALWTSFKFSIIEDFLISVEEPVAENMALREIEAILTENGLDCKKIGLPIPSTLPLPPPTLPLPANAEGVSQLCATLNEEQKNVLDEILLSINGESNQKLFFLEAPGGCGKTFLYSTLLSIIRSRGETALAAAWTGIAALLLEGGKTVHKTFGLSVPITETSVSSIKMNSSRADSLRLASVIIIDEASMVPALAVDCIDRLLRDITRNSQEPMGGKVVVFGGDFRQVLPVVPHAGKVKTIESCIKYSKIWKNVKILHLRRNMRVSAFEVEFTNWLVQLGNDSLPSDIGNNVIKIPDDFVVRDSLLKHVFGSKIDVANPDTYSSKAIVCPLNEDCTKINNQAMDLIEDTERPPYYSVDSIQSNNPDDLINIPLEYLNSLTPSGMPPHKLRLKKGAVVMLIRNMNLGSGLVNGVRMIVRGLLDNAIQLEIITGQSKGNIVFLPRIELICTDSDMPFILKRKQFPIRLAFGMTINKSQGQTFDKIGIYLSRTVFTHGQLYVAFSRVRKAADVKIFIEQTSEQGQFKNYPGSHVTRRY